MKGMIKILSIAFFALSIISCSSSSQKTHNEEAHSNGSCTEHNHQHHDGEHHHHHGMVVVGIAQEGDYASGKIAISLIGSNESKEFDYTKSNQDKIAAWQGGDTVSIFIDHHHHGDVAHDSITAIKIGAVACNEATHEHHNHKH